ncbi:hypothetical protein NIES267_40610 [Calothrix parasitica NIES-267]|uniref:Uncharacterized protein n=1 Tax=Calothrix parasitica NIES-267 TaxID=1973488 RepID=A0A1Z4LTJ1_9CYAN|nr:hypothetical protein NIES267_40610 [Calothrix parasitica NIES-267]
MSWDMLLYWLTHKQEGSWINFRKAAAEIASAEPIDIGDLCRDLRFQLSEASHVDFFIDGSQRWKVRPPILSGLVNFPEIAILCGGRTPKLLSRICDAASTFNCKIIKDITFGIITKISIEGTQKDIRKVADNVGIPYIPQKATFLSQDFVPILKQLENADEGIPLVKWERESFDWQLRRWTDSASSNTKNTVWKYSYYNNRHYFVYNQQGKLVRMPKHEAIYAMAALFCIPLLVYNKTQRTLITDISTPLPELYARVIYLCAGRPSRIEQGQIVYKDIPADLAGLLMVAIGQLHPGLRWVN